MQRCFFSVASLQLTIDPTLLQPIEGFVGLLWSYPASLCNNIFVANSPDVMLSNDECGRPRRLMMSSNSRVLRSPDSDVSVTSAKHSLLKSSTTARTRNRRPSVNERIRYEVEVPPFIRTTGQNHKSACTQSPFGAVTLTHLQFPFSIKPSSLLLAHEFPLKFQYHANASHQGERC